MSLRRVNYKGAPAWQAVVEDITERTMAEKALRDNEQRYRSVIAALAEGVVVMDQAGAILTVNESACRILGLARDELLGRSLFDPRWQPVHEGGALVDRDSHPVTITFETG